MADRTDDRTVAHYTIERELAGGFVPPPLMSGRVSTGKRMTGYSGGCRTTRNCRSTRRSATMK